MEDDPNAPGVGRNTALALDKNDVVGVVRHQEYLAQGPAAAPNSASRLRSGFTSAAYLFSCSHSRPTAWGHPDRRFSQAVSG